MRRIFSLIGRVLLYPLYFAAMLLGALGEDSNLANWAAQRLGLQATPGEKGSSATGKEGLLGLVGEVRSSFEEVKRDGRYRGKVFVRGELWNALLKLGSPRPEIGQKVRVCEVEGLTLIVEPSVTHNDAF